MKLTQKQERFARFLFEGFTQRESWGKAGYSHNYSVAVVDVNACRLASNTMVKLRIAELNKQSEDAAVMSKQEALAKLSEISRANLIDFLSENGQPVLKKDTPNKAAAAEFYHRSKLDKDGNPQVTKSIRLLNPITAIEQIAKISKWYEETLPYQDNRQYNILVADDETKSEIKRLISGGVRDSKGALDDNRNED